MAGTINSLGIGSGILTSDVIDKLRSADEERIIKPLDNKIALAGQKKEAFTLLDSLMTTFKSSVSSLSFDTIYQSRTVDTTGGNVEVQAEAGSNIEDFSLDTTTLAKKDINQSGVFGAKSDVVADGDGVMNIALADGSSFDVDYTASTTLSELADAINTKAGTKVKASILQTGDSEFSLVLSSKATGADQAITINDTPTVAGSGLIDTLYNDTTATSGFSNNQTADDAEFVYNGITISRSSNTITDLMAGVTINLKTEGESANVSIKQDTLAVSTEMKLLVDSYNALQSNLHDMVTSNADTGAKGVFNGDNFIKSIMKEINSVVTSIDGDNNSLVNYGIDIDRHGTMSFNENDFDAKVTADPKGLELFMSGGITADGDTKVGIFETLNDKIKGYTKFNGLFDNFDNGLKKQNEALSDDKVRSIATLDSRYETLSKQFLAYDSLISKLNSQFSSLQLQIQAQANGN